MALILSVPMQGVQVKLFSAGGVDKCTAVTVYIYVNNMRLADTILII